MGINVGGMAAAYQGFMGEQRRFEDDERRRQADVREKQASDFAEEVRNRDRKTWKEQDRIEAEDKADLASVSEKYRKQAEQSAAAADAASAASDNTANASAPPAGGPPPVDAALDGAADAAPAATAAAAPAPARPAGLPKARSFNDVLGMQTELLRNKAARGTLSAKDYAQGMSMLNAMRDEGVNEALKRISAGDYEGGMDAFNSVGQHGNARIVKGEAGTTKINGQDVPTHNLVIANPDGSRTTIDSALAQFQLMDLNTQLAHMDRSRQMNSQEKYQNANLQLQRDQLDLSAKNAAASQALQREQLGLHREQLAAGTPLGQITAIQKALGRKLSTDEIENRMGLSKIPRAVELQVQSLLKAADTDSTAVAKAIASPEGLNPAASALFSKNAALREIKLSELLAPYNGKGGATVSADPLGLRAPAPAPQQQPAPVLRAPGGLQATPAAGQAAPRVPTVTATGMPIAERDRQIDLWNERVGGANMTRKAALDERQADALANFDENLAAINRNMSREDQQRVFSWFDRMADSGFLTNAQLKQVREARRAAGV
jgi:hypothetical protein